MKTILFLILSILPLTARDATFAWDPNPAADQVTGYRLEILNAQGQWVAAGTSTTTTLNLPTFPDAATSIRAIAINSGGESDPSAPLVILAAPSAPKGLRVTLMVKLKIQAGP